MRRARAQDGTRSAYVAIACKDEETGHTFRGPTDPDGAGIVEVLDTQGEVVGSAKAAYRSGGGCGCSVRTPKAGRREVYTVRVTWYVGEYQDALIKQVTYTVE